MSATMEKVFDSDVSATRRWSVRVIGDIPYAIPMYRADAFARWFFQPGAMRKCHSREEAIRTCVDNARKERQRHVNEPSDSD